MADNNRSDVVGTGIGFNNMAVVAGGMFFPPLLGFLLQFNWDGQTINGAPVYSAEDYRFAMFVLPVCYLIGFLVCLRGLRETYCQPQY